MWYERIVFMKNSRLILVVCLVSIILSTALCGCGFSKFEAIKEDGIITVTARNAGRDDVANGYIVVESEGQSVKICAELKDGGAVTINVGSDTDGDGVLDTIKELDVTEDTEFVLPVGEFYTTFTANEGTTGRLEIVVE